MERTRSALNTLTRTTAERNFLTLREELINDDLIDTTIDFHSKLSALTIKNTREELAVNSLLCSTNTMHP